MEHFCYHDGALYAENVAITTLVGKIAPPFYLYSTASLRQNFCSFQAALQQVLPTRLPLVAYALKANANMAVLRLLCVILWQHALLRSQQNGTISRY